MTTPTPPSGPPPPHGSTLGDLVVGLATFALFVASVPVDSDALILGNDVVPYAAGLARGGAHALANPHHLAFHPLAWLALELRGLCGAPSDSVRAALAAQIWVSALGGAVATAILFRAGRALCGVPCAALLAAAFATCAGNWLYGAVGETYLPATAAVAGLLALALRVRLGRAEPRVLPLAAWLLAATLLRQDSVVVVVALPLLLPPRVALRVILLAGALSLAVYAAVWFAAGDGPFVTWLRGLAESGNWGGAPSLFKAAIGAITLQHAFHYGVRFAGAALALSLATTVLAVLAAIPGRGRARVPGARRALAGLGAYALVRHAFFTWWQASNMEYHAGTLLPLALAAAVGIAAQAPPRRRALALLGAAVLSLALGNWTVLLGPNRATTLDDHVRAGLAAAGPGALVLSLSPLQHYAVLRVDPPDARPRVVDEVARFARPAEVAALVDDVRAALADGRAVLVLRDNVTPARLAVAEQRLEPELLAALLAEGAVERLTDDGGDLWGLVIRPTP